MVRISTALIILFLLFTGVFITLWIISPEKNWEPYATAVSSILIPIVILLKDKLDVLNKSDSSRDSIDHDRVVWTRIDQLIGEDFLFKFIDKIGSLSCKTEYVFDFERFFELEERPNYIFLNTDIEIKKALLIDRAEKVRHFIRLNFDGSNVPHIDYVKMCKPEENPYANREEYKGLSYEELSELLRARLNEMKEAYTSFRIEIKKTLLV